MAGMNEERVRSEGAAHGRINRNGELRMLGQRNGGRQGRSGEGEGQRKEHIGAGRVCRKLSVHISLSLKLSIGINVVSL